MGYVLWFVAILLGVNAWSISVNAESAMHQIYYTEYAVCAFILFGLGAVVNAVDANARQTKKIAEAVQGLKELVASRQNVVVDA